MQARKLLERLRIADPWDNEAWQGFDYDEHGWFGDENAEVLDRLLKEKQSSEVCVIEVGCWLGKSTRFFCERAELVIAVDHWQGSIEHQNPARPDTSDRLPHLYQRFLRNTAQYRDRLAPLRMTSYGAAKLHLPSAHLVYIDAGHHLPDVVLDLNSWSKHVSPSGYLCGDDWLWEESPGVFPVQIAVKHFCREGQLRIHVKKNFWWLTREGDSNGK